MLGAQLIAAHARRQWTSSCVIEGFTRRNQVRRLEKYTAELSGAGKQENPRYNLRLHSSIAQLVERRTVNP
jgi:hypothetical protein